MKEFEVAKLYDSMTDIADEWIEEALTVKLRHKSPNWVKGCAAAACFALAAGVSLFLWAKDPKVEVKTIGSLEEIASSYSGNLLAEKLVASGAKTASIRLSYARGRDASDPAAWDTLSITGDYNGQDFTLDCGFDSAGEGKSPDGAYLVTQYGDVEVAIYREESDWSASKDSYLYRAKFTLDGVAYDLSTHSDDLEDIYIYLEMVLGNSEDKGEQPGNILNDVLGFGVCRVEMEEVSRYQYSWHYYVEVDGESRCVAEQFGYDGPEAWSRDLDGDGVPELICINTFGDGAQLACVYRNNNGEIEEGRVQWSYYREKFGWDHIGEGGVASLPVEDYDPERNVFLATDYYTNGYDNPVTVEFGDGLEAFEFFPFQHLP